MFPYQVEEARRQIATARVNAGMDNISYPLDSLAAIPSSGQISVFSGFRKTRGSIIEDLFAAQAAVSQEEQEHLAQFKSIFRR